MSDCRDVNHNWYSNFDEKKMTVTLKWDEEQIIPVKYVVCSTCEGKGKIVNPNIDRQGLSREDFDEDSDFRENYFSGMYDIACNECNGKRVSIVFDEERGNPKQLKMILDWYEEEAADRKTRMMESGGYGW